MSVRRLQSLPLLLAAALLFVLSVVAIGSHASADLLLRREAAAVDDRQLLLGLPSLQVPMSLPESINALSSLSSKQLLPDPVIKSVIVVSGTADTLTVKVPTVMKSPLPFSVPLFGKDLVFQVFYIPAGSSAKVAVGSGTLPKFELKAGEFEVEAIVKMSPKTAQEKSAVNELLQRNANGQASAITMENFKISPSKIPLLTDKLLSFLKFNSSMPPVKDKLISKISMAIKMAQLPKVGTIVDMFNPFDVEINVKHLKSAVTNEKGSPIGNIDQDTALKLAPKVVTSSPSLDATAVIGPDTIELIGAITAGKDIRVSTKATLTLAIQQFPAVIEYAQENVPVAATLN